MGEHRLENPTFEYLPESHLRLKETLLNHLDDREMEEAGSLEANAVVAKGRWGLQPERTSRAGKHLRA